MNEYPLFDVKARLSQLLAGVERGETVVITRRGTAIARIVPVREPSPRHAVAERRQRIAAAMQALAPFRQSLRLGVPLKQAVERGRD
jgi:prevent-host-death family protein